MNFKHKEINIIRHKRYQIIDEATGEVLESSDDFKQANKLLLYTSRVTLYTKLYDNETNRTVMSVGKSY